MKGGAGEGLASEDEKVAAAVEVFEDGLPLGFGPRGAVGHDEQVGVGEGSGQLRGGREGGLRECGVKRGVGGGGGVGGGESGLGEDDDFGGGLGGGERKESEEQKQGTRKDFHGGTEMPDGGNDTTGTR